jgi:hypothetical protein
LFGDVPPETQTREAKQGTLGEKRENIDSARTGRVGGSKYLVGKDRKGNLLWPLGVICDMPGFCIMAAGPAAPAIIAVGLAPEK